MTAITGLFAALAVGLALRWLRRHARPWLASLWPSRKPRHPGKHTEEWLDDQFADDIADPQPPARYASHAPSGRDYWRQQAWAAIGAVPAFADKADMLAAEYVPQPVTLIDFPGGVPAPAGAERLAVRPSTPGGEPSNASMRNWTPRETTVDKSFAAAIRAEIDGDYTGQVVDRYFSQVNLGRIFADLGLDYVAGAA